MSKPKILMVSCDGFGRGGVQAVMMNFVRNLSNSYLFDALLFTNDIRFYDNEFLTYGGRIFRIPRNKGFWLRKKIDYYIRGLSLYFKVKNILSKNGPYQAIHCNNEYEAALCLWAAKRVQIPIRICHSHTICSNSNFLAKIVNSIYGILIKRYATVKIGCSQMACDALYGKNERVMILNNPYDETVFAIDNYEKHNDSRLTITQVGRFDDNKNQLFSIEVLAVLAKRKKVQLNLVGFGGAKYVELVKDKARTLGVEQEILFIDGNSANIPKILSQSDCFIFPSKKEGFGITLIEAQAMGLTCFVSDSVPKTTNVGGCVYLSLNDGPEIWASTISDTSCTKKKYDCANFAAKTIALKMKSIYQGVSS